MFFVNVKLIDIPCNPFAHHVLWMLKIKFEISITQLQIYRLLPKIVTFPSVNKQGASISSATCIREANPLAILKTC